VRVVLKIATLSFLLMIRVLGLKARQKKVVSEIEAMADTTVIIQDNFENQE
jgi:hypothetical protein